MEAIHVANELLHHRASRAARAYFVAEAELLEVLALIDEREAYFELGCTSLYQYAQVVLKLSESVASNFIAVARKARAVPELKQVIREGGLTVSKARKITPVLTTENQAFWISKARELPQKLLEREIAKVCPKEAVHESSVYVTGERLKLTLGVSEELMEQLKRAQDLVSQTGEAATLEDTLQELLEFYLTRRDPVRKAERAKPEQDTQQSVARQIPDRKVPAAIKHAVNRRDQGRCTETLVDGTRCPNRRWLDLHHVMPVSQGGPNTTENLRTLCRAHHRREHSDHSETNSNG